MLKALEVPWSLCHSALLKTSPFHPAIFVTFSDHQRPPTCVTMTGLFPPWGHPGCWDPRSPTPLHGREGTGSALPCSSPPASSPAPVPPGPALLCYPGMVQGLLSLVLHLAKGGASSYQCYSQQGAGPALHSPCPSTWSLVAVKTGTPTWPLRAI